MANFCPAAVFYLLKGDYSLTLNGVGLRVAGVLRLLTVRVSLDPPPPPQYVEYWPSLFLCLGVRSYWALTLNPNPKPTDFLVVFRG